MEVLFCSLRLRLPAPRATLRCVARLFYLRDVGARYRYILH